MVLLSRARGGAGGTDGGGRASQLICAFKRKYCEPHRKAGAAGPMGVVSAAAACVPRPAGGGLVQAREPKRRCWLLKIQQWPRVIGEISRVEDLNAGSMVASERRHIARAASLYGIFRIIEPNTKVIDLHGVDLSAGR